MKNANRPHPMDDFIFMNFYRLHDYIEETHAGITLASRQYQAAMNKMIENKPEFARHFKHLHDSTGKKYEESYLRTLRSSSLILVYSVFETCIIKLCEFARERIKAKLSYKDLSGRDIKTNSKYLKSVIDIDLSHLHSQWTEINNFRIVRNLVVHHHSNLNGDPNKKLQQQEDYQLLKSLRYIKVLRNGDFFITDKEFVLKFASIAHTYLNGVLTEILKLKQKRSKKRLGTK